MQKAYRRHPVKVKDNGTVCDWKSVKKIYPVPTTDNVCTVERANVLVENSPGEARVEAMGSMRVLNCKTAVKLT